MPLNLESRLAQRVLWPLVDGALPRRARPLRAGAPRRLAALDHARADAARRHHRAALAAAQPELRRAAHQGRGLRRAARQPPASAPASTRAGPTCRCSLLLSARARHAVCRHLGRGAVQARLARGQGRGAAEGDAGRRDAGRRRLAGPRRGRPAARPLLRRRHHRHRGGADRLRHRARRCSGASPSSACCRSRTPPARLARAARRQRAARACMRRRCRSLPATCRSA